jgi:hypothetical protein
MKQKMLRNLMLMALFPSLSFAHDGPPLWLLPAVPFVLPFMAMKNSRVRSAAEAVRLEKISEEPLLTSQGAEYGIRVNYRMILGKEFPSGAVVTPSCWVMTKQGATLKNDRRLSCFASSLTNAKGHKQAEYSEQDKTPAGEYRVSYDIYPNGLVRNFEDTELKCLQHHDLNFYFESFEASIDLSFPEKMAAIEKMPKGEQTIELAFSYRLNKPPDVHLPNVLISTKIDPISLLLNVRSMGVPVCK